MKYFDLKGEVVDSGNEWIYDWYGIQAISPKIVQKNLNNANGDDITFNINSGGGSVFAGCDIYNMLMDYKKKANVIIEIKGLCASIAGVIAMAGTTVKMSPSALFMIHNVSGNASGDYRDMEHTAETLKKANETIANAFKLKTGMEDKEIKKIMDHETWFTADEAKDKGIIDEIMYQDQKVDTNMVNLLKNKASALCNSVALNNDIIEKLKQYNPINQPVQKNEVDFLLQQKAKAELELLNLKRKCM
ncbi:MAG: Clp protease ClpP [Clostridiaceae bacterium]|nr:Clp protease ClpP [Clostridiaceae bacterium]